MAKTDIRARIGADLTQFKRKMRFMERTLTKTIRKVERTSNTLMANITLPAVFAAGGFIKSAAEIDKLKMGLVGIMGDSKAAAAEFQKLRKLARNPGLDLRSAVEGSIRLQAIDFSAADASRSIGVMANALALVGGTEADLKGVAVAISQIISKGKVHAEEINQIAERVPQVRLAMEDAFGTANTESLQKMGLDARQFVDGIIDELERLPRAENNISNVLVNMADDFKIVAAQIGVLILPMFTKVATVVLKTVNFFINLNAQTNGMVVNFIAFAAAAGPALWALGKILSVTKNLVGILGGGMLGTGIGAVIAGLALIIIYWDDVTEAVVKATNAAIDLYNENENIRFVVEKTLKFFKDMWATVKAIGKGGAAIFKALWKSATNVFSAGEAYETMKTELAAVGKEFGESLADNAGAAALNISGALKKNHITKADVNNLPAIKYVRGLFASVAKGMTDLTSGGFGGDAPAPRDRVKTWELPRIGSAELEFVEVDVKFNEPDNLSATMTKMREAIEGFVQAFDQVFQGLTQTIDAFFTRKQRLVENDFARQKKAIEASSMLEADKTKMIQELEENKAKKMRGIQMRQAKANKAIAITESLLNGATAVSAALTIPPPLGIALASIVGTMAAIQTGIIAATPLPQLAKGGLAYGITTAVVGDNPNAHVDPEVIAPVSKLVPMIRQALGGGRGQHITATFRARGKDLIAIADRASRTKSRVYGT